MKLIPSRKFVSEAQKFLKKNPLYNRFAKTPHFSAGDEGKAGFQASPEASSKAVESLREKTLGFQPREAYKVKLEKTLNLLRSNYRHPSLRLHKLSGTGNHSVSVDKSVRIILNLEGENIFLLRIGTHDEVY